MKNKKLKQLRQRWLRLTSHMLIIMLLIGSNQHFIIYAKDSTTAKQSEVQNERVTALCERILSRGAVHGDLAKLREDALKAGQVFNGYFRAIGERVLERSYLIDVAKLALVAKEHVLMVGPPGNAKSMFANLTYGGIVDDTDKPSYFKTQMTYETTLSDTHGPVNFKKLEEEGKLERVYSEGILGARLAFLDEIFDMRPNGFRNILDVMAERKHGLHEGLTWSVIAASNRYISQVYEKFGGSNEPQAVLDRVAFAAYVPPEFETVGSYRALIQGVKNRLTPPPKLHFSEVERLQRVADYVQIPDHVSDFLSLMVYQLRPEVEAMEESSKRDYVDKVRGGETALPPWRATKYMSPRTLGKAANILRAIVVLDWLEKEAKGESRPLIANLDDIEKLEAFFTLGGPKDSFVQLELDRSTNPHERQQLQTILKERAFFREHYQNMKKIFNDTVTGLKLAQIAEGIQLYPTMPPEEKAKFMDKLKDLFMIAEVRRATEQTPQNELDPERMAYTALHESIDEWMKNLVGAQQAASVIAKWETELTEEKRLEIAKALGVEQKVAEEAPATGATPPTSISKLYAGAVDLTKVFEAFARERGVDLKTLSGKGVELKSFNIVLVNPGRYKMGSPSTAQGAATTEVGRYDNEDLHDVEISKKFGIGQTPVTQLMYWLATGENPSYHKDQKYADNDFWIAPDGTVMCYNHPVENFNVGNETKFFVAVNKKLQDLGISGEVRHLTEGEWEYAARAGTQTAYYNGDDPNQAGQIGWFSENAGDRTHAVGEKLPNGLGLLDMSGNVWELVADGYTDKLGTSPVKDPYISPIEYRSPTLYRHCVVRGGSCYDFARDLRSAKRSLVTPVTLNKDVGFRLGWTPK